MKTFSQYINEAVTISNTEKKKLYQKGAEKYVKNFSKYVSEIIHKFTQGGLFSDRKTEIDNDYRAKLEGNKIKLYFAVKPNTPTEFGFIDIETGNLKINSNIDKKIVMETVKTLANVYKICVEKINQYGDIVLPSNKIEIEMIIIASRRRIGM